MISRLVAERFTFFGQDLVLVTDVPRVASVLTAVYERHRTETVLAGGPRPRIQVRVLGDPAGGGPAIEVAGRRIRVPAGDQLEHYAHLVMINAAAAVATDRLVLHAGAVAKNGRAVLLVGPSGWGKTTLTLELVRRGWGFLSDDFAPVDATGLVEPFPRRVNLTDASIPMLGVAIPEEAVALASVGAQRKWMIDVEALFPGSLSPPAPLDAVFLMASQHLAPRGGQRWRLRLDQLPTGLTSDLEGLPGVTRVEVAVPGAGALLDVFVTPGAGRVAALEAAFRAHDTSLLSADSARWSEPTFDQEPEAYPLEIAEGVGGLLPHAVTLNGRRFLHGAVKGDSFRELSFLRGATTASSARIFRLEPGALARTADLVEHLSGP